MSETIQSSLWERSTIVRFLRSLTNFKNLRRLLVGVSWTLTLIFLLYGFENWRGRRAWNEYRQKLETQGQQLDVRAFIPKAVPPEDNFAATPFFDQVFATRGNQSAWDFDYNKASAALNRPRDEERGRRHLTDLVGFARAFAAVRAGDNFKKNPLLPGALDRAARAQAAPGILQALKPLNPIIDELRGVSQRLESRYPLEYNLSDPWGILLPHLAVVKGLIQRLSLKACAELALDQNEAAWQDVRLMLRLGDSLNSETFIISYLTRISCMHIALQPIWEGLQEGRWSDTQLQGIVKSLARYDMLAAIQTPLHMERAGTFLTADLLYQQKYRFRDFLEGQDEVPSILFGDLLSRWAPRGWFHFEQVNYGRIYEEYLLGAYDLKQRRFYPQTISEKERGMQQTLAPSVKNKLHALLKHQLLVTMMLPSLRGVYNRTAAGQADIDQASLATALALYQQANGEFPESLAGLVPMFIGQLPHDVITGENYKYQRQAKDKYLLYSVGWNERDDGGVAGKVLFDREAGDWVWN